MANPYNIFSLYINIITRINYMVDYIPRVAMEQAAPEVSLRHQFEEYNFLEAANQQRFSKLLFKRDRLSGRVQSKERLMGCNYGSNIGAHAMQYGIANSAPSSASSSALGQGFRNKLNHFIKTNNTMLLDDIEHSLIHLAFFMLMVSVSVLIVSKQLLHSTFSSADDKVISRLLVKAREQPEIDGDDPLSSWKDVGDLMTSNIFLKFSQCQLYNIVAGSLLLPSCFSRVLQVLLLSKKIIRKMMGKRTRDEINTVQLDLSYLDSLIATTRHWYLLLTRSLFHKHRYTNYERYLNPLLNHFENGQFDYSELGYKSKIYVHNLIGFDSCYQRFFSDHCKQTELEEEDMLEIASSRQSLKTEMRRKYLRKRNIFVAEPIHRIDVTYMFWLLSMLVVLYVLTTLSILLPVFFFFLIELNIKSLQDMSLERLIVGWRKFVGLGLISRFLQAFIWQTLVLLATFDLFNFFSCCLICYSRARDIRERLVNVIDFCSRLRSSVELSRKERGFLCSQMRTTSIYYSRCVTVRQRLSIDNLNKTIETNIDCIMALIWELNDIKKFFGLYLSMELISKILALIYVTGIFVLGTGHLFEYGFLLINSNTAVTPILIVLIMATLVEGQFRRICLDSYRVLVEGRNLMSRENHHRLLLQIDYLAVERNRSFVLLGHFSLSLGSLLPMLTWIATGVLLLKDSWSKR